MVTGTVISLTELDKIRDCLREETGSDENRRQALHELSKARADTWTNTLAGSRRKKAQMRLEEFEREERKREVIDAQEAKHQLEKRKDIINFANQIIFDDSDRVKSFKSRMMHSDVIAERQAQMELSEELQKLELIREERYLEMDRQNYRKMLERELTEKADLEKRIKEQAESQAEQREKKTQIKKSQEEELQREGMIIRLKAKEDLNAEIQLADQRKRQAREIAMTAMRASEYSKEIRRGEEMRAKKEDELIVEYAKKKEQMIQLRKEKEAQLQAVKMAARQKMIDKQTKQLTAMRSNEEARVQSQVEEKEAEKEAARLKKEEDLENMKRDIDKSRRAQIERKNFEREMEVAEEAEVGVFWREFNKKLNDEEEEDRSMRRREAEAIAHAQLKQVAIRKRQEREEKRVENKTTMKAKMNSDTDNLDFHKFAEEVIQEYAADGKNILPLLKKLQEDRKRGEQ